MTVSITHRVAEVDETAGPATVCALLRELDMSHACVEAQKVALGGWLAIHEPPRQLRISLRENGYGLLLREADGKRPKPGSGVIGGTAGV